MAENGPEMTWVDFATSKLRQSAGASKSRNSMGEQRSPATHRDGSEATAAST